MRLKKIQVVDLARCFSIFAVLAFHFGLSHVAVPSGPGLIHFLWFRFCMNGAYGVQIFFVISGFLITRFIAESREGLFKPRLRTFYSRRAGRILPLLVLSILLGLMAWFLPKTGPSGFCLANPDANFGVPFWGSIASFTFNWYRAFLAPVHDFGLHWDILWSLSIEEQFYLFFPLVLWWLGRERNLTGFLGFFILLGPLVRGLGVVLDPDSTYWNLNSFAQFDLIALGSLLYLVSEKLGKGLRGSKTTAFILCFAGAFILMRTFVALPTPLDYERRVFGPSFIGIGAFLFLLGAIHLKGFESRFLAPFAIPGKLSYGGYLLHPIVLCLLWSFLKAQNESVSFCFFILAVTGIAWVSYRFYESPANLWVQSILDPKGRMKKRK